MDRIALTGYFIYIPPWYKDQCHIGRQIRARTA